MRKHPEPLGLYTQPPREQKSVSELSVGEQLQVFLRRNMSILRNTHGNAAKGRETDEDKRGN